MKHLAIILLVASLAVFTAATGALAQGCPGHGWSGNPGSSGQDYHHGPGWHGSGWGNMPGMMGQWWHGMGDWWYGGHHGMNAAPMDTGRRYQR